MAINPRAAALALLLGTAAAGAAWAQTETAPATGAGTAAPAAAPTADTTAPAAGDAATDAAAPATEAAEAPAGEAAPAPDAPAAADAAPAQPSGPAASAEAASVGQYYVDSTHGDWTLRCIKAPEGTDPCELYQLLQDGNGNSVSEVSIIPLTGEAAAGATIVAPLETDLIAGLGWKIDSGQQQGYPFNFCAPVGCVARVGFTQAEVDALKRGNAVTVSLLPFGLEAEGRVDLSLSLRGFTAGIDAVAAKMPAPEARAD